MHCKISQEFVFKRMNSLSMSASSIDNAAHNSTKCNGLQRNELRNVEISSHQRLSRPYAYAYQATSKLSSLYCIGGSVPIHYLVQQICH